MARGRALASRVQPRRSIRAGVASAVRAATGASSLVRAGFLWTVGAHLVPVGAWMMRIAGDEAGSAGTVWHVQAG